MRRGDATVAACSRGVIGLLLLAAHPPWHRHQFFARHTVVFARGTLLGPQGRRRGQPGGHAPWPRPPPRDHLCVDRDRHGQWHGNLGRERHLSDQRERHWRQLLCRQWRQPDADHLHQRRLYLRNHQRARQRCAARHPGEPGRDRTGGLRLLALEPAERDRDFHSDGQLQLEYGNRQHACRRARATAQSFRSPAP